MLLLAGFHRVIQQSSGIGSSDKLIGKSKDVTSPKAQVTDRKGNWQCDNTAIQLQQTGGKPLSLAEGAGRRLQVTARRPEDGYMILVIEWEDTYPRSFLVDAD